MPATRDELRAFVEAAGRGDTDTANILAGRIGPGFAQTAGTDLQTAVARAQARLGQLEPAVAQQPVRSGVGRQLVRGLSYGTGISPGGLPAQGLAENAAVVGGAALPLAASLATGAGAARLAAPLVQRGVQAGVPVLASLLSRLFAGGAAGAAGPLVGAGGLALGGDPNAARQALGRVPEGAAAGSLLGSIMRPSTVRRLRGAGRSAVAGRLLPAAGEAGRTAAVGAPAAAAGAPGVGILPAGGGRALGRQLQQVGALQTGLTRAGRPAAAQVPGAVGPGGLRRIAQEEQLFQTGGIAPRFGGGAAPTAPGASSATAQATTAVTQALTALNASLPPPPTAAPVLGASTPTTVTRSTARTLKAPTRRRAP